MGTYWAGMVGCAGAVAWDPSLPLVVQDDTTPRGSVALGASEAQWRHLPRIGPGAGLPRGTRNAVLS